MGERVSSGGESPRNIGGGPMTIIASEGALVGFLICEKCGAALLCDPREKGDPVMRHQEWHRELEDRDV